MGEGVTNLLITVKTYPALHKKYREVVCSAGVTESGDFVRLFPVPFRYLPHAEQFRKYQWISVHLVRYTPDSRPDTYQLKKDTKIQLLGNPIGSERYWERRRKVVLAKPMETMCAHERKRRPARTLGIVHVRKIQRVSPVRGKADWNGELRRLLEQEDMFEGFPKPLDQIPFGFHVKFLCDEPRCGSHTKNILDWEVGQLFRRLSQKHSDNKEAALLVTEHLQRHELSDGRDKHFFVGTLVGKPKPTWSIMGMFCPFKKPQQELPLNAD